jgi:hypothetical protein
MAVSVPPSCSGTALISMTSVAKATVIASPATSSCAWKRVIHHTPG